MARSEKQERNRTHTNKVKHTQAKAPHTQNFKLIGMPKFYQKQVDKAKEIYESGSYWNILCAHTNQGKPQLLFLNTDAVYRKSKENLHPEWFKRY